MRVHPVLSVVKTGAEEKPVDMHPGKEYRSM
jgi:hypothetical protein